MGRSTNITISGWGAVSPAGWGVAPLWEAKKPGLPGLPEERQREGAGLPVKVRSVPPAPKEAAFRHPRLRRASPQVKFAAAACLEALGEERALKVQAGALRLGIVFATVCGAVQYSNRFYQEVLNDPATASPILFPETVFNAAASHLSSILGSSSANYTLVGDTAEFLAALRVARDWLLAGEVDGCLVVGAEELDWISCEAMQLFAPGMVAAEGAGALYLETAAARESAPIVLESVTEPALWLNLREKQSAARLARARLPDELSPGALLVLSVLGQRRHDSEELAAWEDWSGPRMSPGTWLGNSVGAAMALNGVLACEALARGDAAEAIVSGAGHHHQCLAAWLRTG